MIREEILKTETKKLEKRFVLIINIYQVEVGLPVHGINVDFKTGGKCF